MNKEQPSLRFDHREIAVIFSLFVFVSLLMFTVGILVGKGLAQAKYESVLIRDNERLRSSELARPDTSEDTNPEMPEIDTTPTTPDNVPPPAVEAAAPPSSTANRQPADAKVETIPPKQNNEPLKLVPQKARQPDVYGNSLQEPTAEVSQESQNILNNPKIKGLFDDEPAQKKRGTASVAPKKAAAPNTFPASYAKGKFTVQVGSYPTEKDAAERVEALKKMGFPHAYFSAKEIGEKKETYYRVGLGYFADLQTAEQSGQILQQKGEVKNYLVRKTDSDG